MCVPEMASLCIPSSDLKVVVCVTGKLCVHLLTIL